MATYIGMGSDDTQRSVENVWFSSRFRLSLAFLLSVCLVRFGFSLSARGGAFFLSFVAQPRDEVVSSIDALRTVGGSQDHDVWEEGFSEWDRG